MRTRVMLLCSLTLFCLLVESPPLHSQPIAWSPANGPYGGPVFSLFALENGGFLAGGEGGLFLITGNGTTGRRTCPDPTYAFLDLHDGSLLAATIPGGILRSWDAGATWVPLSAGASSINAYALARDSGGWFYAGTRGSGVQRSTDNGATWNPVNNGLTNLDLYALTVNAVNVLYAGTARGLFRSGDQGDTWTSPGGVGPFTTVEALMVVDQTTLLAGTVSYIFRSADAGSSWSQVRDGLTTTDFPALAGSGATRLFAGSWGKGVFQSVDGGEHWAPANNGIPGEERVAALAVVPGGRALAGSGADPGAVFQSTDEGTTWTGATPGITMQITTAVAVAPNGDVFAGSWGGGVYYSSDNGQTWEQRNTSLADLRINHTLRVTPEGDVLAGTPSGAFRSTDNGGNWVTLNPGPVPPYVTGISSWHRDTLLLSSCTGVYRSTDCGRVWTLVLESPVRCTQSPVFAADGSAFIGLGSDVYRSTDAGATWSLCSAGLPRGDLCDVNTLFPASTGELLAGTLGIYRSTDNGGSWHSLNTGIEDIRIFSIAEGLRGVFYAGTYGGGTDGVFLSIDFGGHWVGASAGLPALGVYNLAVSPKGFVFAATPSRGLFSAGDLSVPVQIAAFSARLVTENWVEVKWTTLSETNNYGFTVQQADLLRGPFRDIPGSFTPGHGTSIVRHDYVFSDRTPGAAAHFFRLRQSDLDGRESFSEAIAPVGTTGIAGSSTPLVFALGQNHPNPFNPTTRIQLTIDNRQWTIVKVFDVLGREIATLMNEVKEPGTYTVQFDARLTGGQASHLAGGVYFYSLTAGEYVASRKMVLMK